MLLFHKHHVYLCCFFVRHVKEWTVICAPVCLIDSKYTRNAFQFTAGLILSYSAQEGSMKAVAMHLAIVFQTLEVKRDRIKNY